MNIVAFVFIVNIVMRPRPDQLDIDVSQRQFVILPAAPFPFLGPLLSRTGK